MIRRDNRDYWDRYKRLDPINLLLAEHDMVEYIIAKERETDYITVMKYYDDFNFYEYSDDGHLLTSDEDIVRFLKTHKLKINYTDTEFVRYVYDKLAFHAVMEIGAAFQKNDD